MMIPIECGRILTNGLITANTGMNILPSITKRGIQVCEEIIKMNENEILLCCIIVYYFCYKYTCIYIMY